MTVPEVETDERAVAEALKLGVEADDEDAVAAFQAMCHALARPITHGHPNRFWLVDGNGPGPVDIVAVVDLIALGQIAMGTRDWRSEARAMSLYPVGDPHATQEALKAVTSAIRERRADMAPIR